MLDRRHAGRSHRPLATHRTESDHQPHHPPTPRTRTPHETTSTPIRRRTRLRAARFATVAGLASVVACGPAFASTADTSPESQVLEVDIAEDGTRFVIDEAPVFDDGFPAHGNPFVTQGYIYPAGTLTDSNGVNPDGTPEFPDKVIGEWSCSGYFIGDGAHATEGAWVYTTQLFAFGDDADTGPRPSSSPATKAPKSAPRHRRDHRRHR